MEDALEKEKRGRLEQDKLRRKVESDLKVRLHYDFNIWFSVWKCLIGEKSTLVVIEKIKLRFDSSWLYVIIIFMQIGSSCHEQSWLDQKRPIKLDKSYLMSVVEWGNFIQGMHFSQ